MEPVLKWLFASYIFLFCSIYIVYGMFERTINDQTGISPKTFSSIDIIYFLKMPGAALYTAVADRTGRHKLLIAISLSLFVAFSWGFCILEKFNISIENSTRINSGLLFFSMSGVFPLIDSISLSYLNSINGVDRYFTLIIISQHVGCLLSNILYSSVYNRFPAYLEKTEHLVVSLISAILAIFCLYFVPAGSKKTKKNKNISFGEYLSEIEKILCSKYSLILISICLEGIIRRGVSSFLPAYLQLYGFKKQEISGMRIFRDILGILNCLLIKKFRKRMGYFTMLNIGVLCNLIRVLILNYFGSFPFDKSGKGVLYVLSEVAKGLYSTFFFYSVGLIANAYSNDHNRAIFQGMNSGTYNGLGAMISGVIGYFTFSNAELNLQKDNFNTFFDILLYSGIASLCISIIMTFSNRNKLK
ncbi:hypothetical protein DMUE_3668 [Dictyocoela muelleri]|nr:hypothetical protein DMUE_3668 [Dictyocoela muelleri]